MDDGPPCGRERTDASLCEAESGPEAGHPAGHFPGEGGRAGPLYRDGGRRPAAAGPHRQESPRGGRVETKLMLSIFSRNWKVISELISFSNVYERMKV